MTRRTVPRGDLLIIECDSQGLARAAMDLGTWFAAIASLAFRARRIALIQTSTEKKLTDDIDRLFVKHKRFRSILIVGHSDKNELVMTANTPFPWAEVGHRIKRFQPRRLFLCACEAGHSATVRNLFESIKSLQEIYASPVPLLKIHAAPLGVLIGMELLNGKIGEQESAGLRLAGFIQWGIQTYLWRRGDMGPGKELAAQSWDDLARCLGVTNWDLTVMVTDWLKKALSQ